MKVAGLAALALVLVLPLPAEPDVDPEVEFVSVEPVTEAGSNTRAEIRVSHPGNGGTYEVTVRAETSVPVAREAMSEWLAGESTSETTVLYSEQVELGGGDTRLNLELATGDQSWGYSLESWGPRGLEVEVSPAGSDDGVTDRSILITAPSFDITPMKFTTVVPLVVTPETLGQVTAPAQRYENLAQGGEEGRSPNYVTIGAALRRSASDVAEQIELLSVDGVTLALDSAYASPDLGMTEIISDSLQGFASPDSREVLLLPYLDADMTAWADLGHDDLFASSLTRMNEAQDVLARIGVPARQDVFVPATSVTGPLLSSAWDHNFETVVVSDEDYPVATPSYWTPAAATTVDGSHSAIVTDTRMSQTLTKPDLSDLNRRQLLLAESALHVRERPNDPRPFVLTVPRYDDNLAEIASLVETMGSVPWLTPTTLSSIESGPDHGLEREDLPSVPDRSGQLSVTDVVNLTSAVDELVAFSHITFDPAAYADPATTVRALVTSAAWRQDPEARGALVNDVITQADQTREGIVALESSTINLIAQASDFPVRISSSLPIDASIEVKVESSDRRLRFTPVEAVLRAESVTTVTVPVTAVGSGNVSVTVQAYTPEGQPVGAPAEIDVRVRADWENLGTGILAGLFLIILIVGVVRSARRGPRTRPVDPASGDYDG